MKKILSLILVACMAFSCLALSACVWEGMFGTTETTIPTASTTQPTTKPTTSTTTTTATTTTTTTTIPDDGGEPEDLVIRHGDNFTEDDIEFVKSLQGRIRSINVEWNHYTICDIVEAMNYGLTLFIGEVNINNPYYICAYLDNSQYYEYWKYDNYSTPLDVASFEWYKFSDIDSIPQTMNKGSRVWSFAVCDCTIVKDAVNDIPYNHQIKYYIEIDGINDVPKITNQQKILIHASEEDFTQNWFKYRNQEIYSNTFYDLYTDENGQEYISFLNSISNLDGVVLRNVSKDDLHQYYETVLPYFISLEHLNYKQSFNGEQCTYQYAGIKIKDLLLIKEGVSYE